VLILGATSAIAQETARLFAAAGDKLFLVARNPERLEAVVHDLKTRGAVQVESLRVDLARTEDHASLIERAQTALGGLDVALIAHGTLGDQKASERDWELAERELRTNFLSAASLLTHLGNRFEAQRGGTIAVISSVAGDRGRQSNYVYGSAKAALSTFAAGLRNRLFKAGVHVVTVKPGFVDTPMTAHLPKNALFVGPDKIARGIVRAIERKRDVVYLPWFWRWILLVIRSVPERVFKRLSL
jgi:decaprenylphospho-beta-D-erythro-pentofuranosid-2-ulose 2-reductase